MKKIVKIVITLLILFPVFSCNSTRSKSQDKTISISGAFALYPITVKWAEEYQKLHPDIRIDISAGGAGKGMTDALTGMVDIGMFSREVSTEEEKKGAWKIALAKDAVLPTISSKNPYLKEILKYGITSKQLSELFITKNITSWDQVIYSTKKHKDINVYTRSDACGAAAMWAKFMKAEQEDLIGIGVFGDPGMAGAIQSDQFSIGYNNVIYVFDPISRKKYEGLEVIPIDLNKNGFIEDNELIYESLNDIMEAIKNEIYPSPPARDLYFITKGKPEKKVIIDFIKWILTDGQRYLSEAGYVQLNDEKIAQELKKISE